MCNSSVKNLVSRLWKNENLDLTPGSHFIDEVVTVRLSGTVRKEQDTLCSPTVSIPLIFTLALFWEKSGVTRGRALEMLKESISEALSTGKETNGQIEAKMLDVQKAVDAVKNDLIGKLPKQKRNGRVNTKGLEIEVLTEEAAAPAAA